MFRWGRNNQSANHWKLWLFWTELTFQLLTCIIYLFQISLFLPIFLFLPILSVCLSVSLSVPLYLTHLNVKQIFEKCWDDTFRIFSGEGWRGTKGNHKEERETDRENILTNCMFVSTEKVGWIKRLTFFKMLLIIKPVIIGKHTELPIWLSVYIYDCLE